MTPLIRNTLDFPSLFKHVNEVELMKETILSLGDYFHSSQSKLVV